MPDRPDVPAPPDLAIVTCCRDYGRYLEDWARSLVDMTAHPAMVGIVDAGSTDDTPSRVEEAARILRVAGIRVRTERIESRNLGTARNAAVALADTEWVQHLDCDDTAMPHMVEEFARIAPDADVICAGYERTGDLAAGPSFRRKLYKSSQGQATRDSVAPASGVSPFRRSLWEQSPYREDMIGGWDTALWLAFSHLDPPARFRPTKRTVFWYRQHADSVFNARRKNERRSKLAGHRLEAVRQGFEGVSVVVPWRPDNGARDRAWEWVRRRYEALHPGWEIVTGTCDGEWRKGEAIADALERASGWTLVIADADCVVPPEALEEAVRLVTEDGVPWVVPHTMVHRLSEDVTADVLASAPGEADFEGRRIRSPYKGFAGGGLVVVERADYEAAGGVPRAFRGWGCEDEALAEILDSLIGPHVRLDYDLWHLWHPVGRRQSHPRYRENRRMLKAIRARTEDPDVLWSLLQDLRGGALHSRRQKDRVRMVALKDHMHGTRHVPAGATFTATETEARRYAAQKDPVAVRRSVQVGRAQQKMVQEAQNLASFRDRKLAAAGTRERARKQSAPALMAFQQGERVRPTGTEGSEAEQERGG